MSIVFRNLVIFYGEELLAPRPTPKLEDHPLSAVRDCIFAATLPIRRPFLHPQPEDAPCRGDRDRLIVGLYFLRTEETNEDDLVWVETRTARDYNAANINNIINRYEELRYSTLHIKIQFIPHREQSVTISKTSQYILHRETTTVVC
jgi:hypothetical protein